MVRFIVIAAGSLIAAALDALNVLTLWNGKAELIIYGITLFVIALGYGMIGEGMKKNKAVPLKRVFAGVATYGLIFTGVLRLPFSGTNRWEDVIGISRGALADVFAIVALAGMGLTLFSLLSRESVPRGYRGKLALLSSAAVLMLLCTLLLIFSYAAALPGFIRLWAEPAALGLNALANLMVFLVLRRAVKPRM